MRWRPGRRKSCRAWKSTRPGGSRPKVESGIILGGERGGLPIPGFDLGNSPAEYTRERVAGKTVVFTTTNGTRAMQRCKQASRVLLGAFVNFSAVCRELGGVEQVVLVCAGTDGHVTREDTLFAGAVVDDLARAKKYPSSTTRRCWRPMPGRRLCA